MDKAEMPDKVRHIVIALIEGPMKLALLGVALLATIEIWTLSLPSAHVVLALALSAVIYVLIRLQCGFDEHVASDSDAILLRNAVKSEIKFILGFLTVMYLSGYSGHREITVTFLGLNMIVQLLTVPLSQLIRIATAGSHIRNSMSELGLMATATAKTALVYGTGPRGKRIVEMLTSNQLSEITPIGFVDSHCSGLWSYREAPLLGGIEDLPRIILERQVDLVFIAAENEDLPDGQRVIEIAERMGAPVCVLPDIYETRISRCRLKTFNGRPALVYSSATDDTVATWVKGALDRTIAALALVLAAPLMLATALAIKLTSRGPALFTQARLGKHGRPFTVYKFRSMYCDAEMRKRELLAANEMTGPVFKMRNDPRITPVGRFIRKYSIDELPQLFNVLAGDMSLVGPRPALPSEVAKFSPWQRRKLAVKPGVTCIWQVSGRNDIDFDDWMKLDLEYVDNWSLWLDTKILARTVPTVLKGTGC